MTDHDQLRNKPVEQWNAEDWVFWLREWSRTSSRHGALADFIEKNMSFATVGERGCVDASVPRAAQPRPIEN